MVTYHHERTSSAQVLSPRCPKCDSLRTEVIGLSTSQKATFLRCGVCGARSEIPVRDAAARTETAPAQA